MLFFQRVTGRIVIEQTASGWHYGVQRRRFLHWRVRNWSPWTVQLNECILALTQAYLYAEQTASGVRIRRGERKRRGRKIVEKLVG